MKVFDLSFHRTGTRSLAKYLYSLGIRAKHWVSKVDGVSYQARIIPCLDRRADIVDALRPVIDRYDALGDVPFSGLYEELLAAYPDSRFIMLVRPTEDWWNSISAHWRLHEKDFISLQPFEVVQYSKYFAVGSNVFTIRDWPLFISSYEAHKSAVRAHFDAQGRAESLLVADLYDSRKNEKISRFLGIDAVPPFPHVK